jgi:hypothetical protein
MLAHPAPHSLGRVVVVVGPVAVVVVVAAMQQQLYGLLLQSLTHFCPAGHIPFCEQ